MYIFHSSHIPPLTDLNDLACKVELLVVKVRSIQVLSEEWKEKRDSGEKKERERRRGRIEEEGKDRRGRE